MARRGSYSAAVVLLALALAPTSARADPSIDECVAKSESGQRSRDGGRYLEARQALLLCASPSCPAPIVRDCTTWLGDLDRAMPTIVVSVRDPQGRDVANARVSIDGAAAEPPSGLPVPLDPGEHRVSAEAPGFAPSSQTIILLAAEKNRPVSATLATTRPAETRAASHPSGEPGRSSPWPFALGLLGVGALGVGASVFVGLDARGDLADAKASRCALSRSCPEADGDSIDRRLVVADVLLGVGLLALVGAGAWLLFHPSRTP